MIHAGLESHLPLYWVLRVLRDNFEENFLGFIIDTNAFLDGDAHSVSYYSLKFKFLEVFVFLLFDCSIDTCSSGDTLIRIFTLLYDVSAAKIFFERALDFVDTRRTTS